MSAKKRSFIKDAIKRARILIDDAAKLGFKALLPMAGPIGGALAFALEIATAPSAEAAEINPSLEEEMMCAIVNLAQRLSLLENELRSLYTAAASPSPAIAAPTPSKSPTIMGVCAFSIALSERAKCPPAI